MANAESRRRYRESHKQDPDWLAAEREKTRKRVAKHRARKKAGSGAGVTGSVTGSVTGLIDLEPEPGDRLARIRWKFWRDIREKELATGESIFRGTCPEDLERYQLRFGLNTPDSPH